MSAQAYPAQRTGGLGDSLAAVFATYHWELRKLVAQRRSWAGLAAAAIVELVFLVSIEISKVTPNDGPYADPMGAGLRHSGLALTPVVLKEIAYFGPAIVAALVGGDIVANEDGGGTLKTILVRSVRQGPGAVLLRRRRAARLRGGGHRRRRRRLGVPSACERQRTTHLRRAGARVDVRCDRRLRRAGDRDRQLRPAALGRH